MQRLATILIGTLAFTATTTSAAFDLPALLLKKIAARATPADESSADGAWTGQQPTPPESLGAAGRERHGVSPLDVPTFESRFGGKAWKTRFAAGGISSRAEIGYDGDLRLYLDKPTLGGNLSMSFVEDSAGGKLHVEFKYRF